MGLSAGIRCDCNRLEWKAPCPHDGGLLFRRELCSAREQGAIENLLAKLPTGAPGLSLLRRRVLGQQPIAVEDLGRLRAEVDALRGFLETNPSFDLPREDAAQRYLLVNEGRPALERFATLLRGIVTEALEKRRAIEFSA